MKAKSKAPSQFTLDHVAPFVADLRSNVVAPHPTCIGEPYRMALPLDVQGTFQNNKYNAERHPRPMCTLGQARRPKEEGSEKCATKMAKKLKKATGRIEEGTKTRTLVEFDNSESENDESNDGLSKGNSDTSHVEASDDSFYLL
jgi:hypothetical protein